MTEPEPATVVAVINTSDDIVTLLRQVLDDEGYRSVSAHIPDIKQGREDLVAFLEEHDPRVIIYDIGPPYEENWTFFRLIQDLDAVKGRRFVVTSTNKRALEEQVGPTDVIELVGKPYDLEEIVQAVGRAAHSQARDEEAKD